VTDLLSEADDSGSLSFRTQREPPPDFVSEALAGIYEAAGLRKGCTDLVIWDVDTPAVRLVEVKCPHWDRPSVEQEKCLEPARCMGIPASIVEWEFAADPAQPSGEI
jgi:hypothetical protein